MKKLLATLIIALAITASAQKAYKGDVSNNSLIVTNEQDQAASEQLDIHKTNNTAHAALFAAKPSYQDTTNIARTVEGWLTFTNLTGSVTLTNQYEAPIAISGTGAVSVAFSGLRVPYPLYFTAHGFTSMTAPAGSYVVGGGSWQTNRVNHFIVWQYSTNLYLNPVITSEIEQ